MLDWYWLYKLAEEVGKDIGKDLVKEGVKKTAQKVWSERKKIADALLGPDPYDEN